jgi:predicted ATP-binding protein involved in virulence
MGKSHFKKAISSLESRIAEHKEKIRLELDKEFPDSGLINHWEKEVKAFEQGIKQALKRLGKN